MIKGTKILWLVILVAILFGLFNLLQPKPVSVETALIKKGSFTATVEEDGRTRVRDRFIVSAPLAGRVMRSPLLEGDAVSVGSLLTTILPYISPLLDPRVRQELEEKVGNAQAAVEEFTELKKENEVLLERARTDLQRTRELKDRGVSSIAQYDKDLFTFLAAERDVFAAERRRHAAEHLLEQSKAALQRTGEGKTDETFPVTSPIDGRVLRVIQKSEAVVSLGTPLIELGDITDLEIAVDLLTTDAAKVETGALVRISGWGGEKVLKGRVRRVEPSGFTKISALGVEEQRVWVIIDITSPREEWTTLGDGYRVEIQIFLETQEAATVIPVGALFRRAEEWCVFKIENSIAKMQEVQIGSRSGMSAVVSSGLSPGDIVVLYPPSELSDGQRVRLLN
ncbi:MAG: efflux RND transporter periplasmic adaptor subunit [Hyphomicrobium sp.]